MRVCGNKVLRRIFGPSRDKVTGEWIKLHNGYQTGEEKGEDPEEHGERIYS